MSVVWSSSSSGESVVNLAPVQDGVILYPDLVKVKVDETDNSIVGFDASHYAYNHHQRIIQSPQISLQTATASVSIPPVGEGRLTLIPLRETQEVLAYEFECHQNGTYYIYIDARTASGVYLSVTGLPIFVAARRTLTLSDTSWRLSLSPVAIVQAALPLWRARVPRISSAS